MISLPKVPEGGKGRRYGDMGRTVSLETRNFIRNTAFTEVCMELGPDMQE